jgi:hypothetical protein
MTGGEKQRGAEENKRKEETKTKEGEGILKLKMKKLRRRGLIMPKQLHAKPIEQDKENGDGDGDRNEHTVMTILFDPVQCLF